MASSSDSSWRTAFGGFGSLGCTHVLVFCHGHRVAFDVVRTMANIVIHITVTLPKQMVLLLNQYPRRRGNVSVSLDHASEKVNYVKEWLNHNVALMSGDIGWFPSVNTMDFELHNS